MTTISQDYTEDIEDLKEDLAEGQLKEDDQLQILRSTESITADYYPIIDWYYPVADMEELLTPDVDDTEEDIQTVKDTKKQYEADKPSLETITVKDCLAEMIEWDKVIK